MKLDEYIEKDVNPFLHVENIIFDVAESMVRESPSYNSDVLLIEDVAQSISHLLIESNGFETLPSDDEIKAFAKNFWTGIVSMSKTSPWWTRDSATT